MPIKALTGDDIDFILRNIYFIREKWGGIFARDSEHFIPEKRPVIVVLNTDYFNAEGIHWIVLFKKKDCNVFFDSLGFSISEYNFTHLINDKKVLITSSKRFQPLSSPTCGYFAIYIIYYLALGFNLDQILKSFNTPEYNSKLVYNFVLKIWMKIRLNQMMKYHTAITN